MQFIYRLLRIGLIFLILLMVASIFFLDFVDRTPYTDQEYYKNTILGIEDAKKEKKYSTGDTIQVGWGQFSLLPNKKIPLAGYSKRNGAPYEFVNDTVWAKALVFDNGIHQLLYVSLDLLIFPPEVTHQIDPLLDSMGFDISSTFLSASHTHSSLGGWAPGYGGNLFAGKYDPKVVDHIVEAIINATSKAIKNKKIAKLGYSAVQAGDQVTNRLVGDVKGTIDPWLRFLKIEQVEGHTALLCNFSAHATCLSHEFMGISGDYPGMFCRNLIQAENIDFAIFSAGAMGSMEPLSAEEKGLGQVEKAATNLSEQVRLIQNFTPVNYVNDLGSIQTPLKLGEPQWRIAKHIRLRPWVFEKVFGKSPSYISSIKIGDVLFIGTPCDFSGELVSEIELYARKSGIHVMITSFNGGYAGYITKDEWYDLDKYETRMMNWYGPENGAYFTEIIKKVIDTYAEDY